MVAAAAQTSPRSALRLPYACAVRRAAGPGGDAGRNARRLRCRPLPRGVADATPTGRARTALALIVDDCGQWIETERGFVALDIPLTLSVLPDVPYTSVIARKRRMRERV